MRRDSFLPIALLAGIYLLTGIIGHDPWRGADAAHLGPVLEMLGGRSTLYPSIGGAVLPDFGPLYYWVAALLAQSLGVVLPIHDAARIATSVFAALALLGLWHACRRLDGEESAPASLLLTLGCLGLVIHAHENQPMLALMAAQAWALAGAAGIAKGVRGSGVLCGLGAGAAILAAGVDGALLCMPLPLIALLARRSDGMSVGRQTWTAVGVSILSAAAWLIPFAMRSPDALQTWLAVESASFSLSPPDGTEVGDWLKLLAWFVWPLWPLALWRLWRARGRLFDPAICIPLSGLALGMLQLLLFSNPNPARAIPLIAPLALLAAQAMPALKRGGAAAFDWFALATFSFFGLLLICSWSAMISGWPPGLARHFRKLAPAFELAPSIAAIVVAGVICVCWLTYLALRRAAGRDAALTWAIGMTAMWCLAVTLLQPWFNYGKSYRTAAESLSQALPGEYRGCVASLGLGPSQRSSMQYFAGLQTRISVDGKTGCQALLTYGQPDTTARALEKDGWKETWEYRRGGGRQFEVFRLYRRN